MKKLLLLLLFPLYAWGQTTDANLKAVQIDPKIRNITTSSGITKGAVSDVLQAVVNSKVSRIEANATNGTNTYTATITWVTGYSLGLNFPIVFTTGNTGASTININTLGAIALKKNGGTALSSGDLANGQVFWLWYDGSNFQVIGIGSSSGGGTWGSITGTLSSQTDLQTALNAKANSATTLSGYGITDAQPLDSDLTTIAGLTATTNNTIMSVGGAWASITPTQVKSTLAIANTDVSGLGTLSTQNGTFSGTSSGTNTGDQTITLTSDVTGSGTGSFATTIAAGAVSLSKMANMTTSSLIYRKTAGSGAPEVNTLATLKTDLGLTGTNSGDQTITLTGGVTGSGTGSFAATVVTNANLTGPITSVGNATSVTAGSITNSMLAGSIDLTSKVTGLLPHANIASTAVTPGGYTNANITVAADGSITAASNGSGGSGLTPTAEKTTNYSASVSDLVICDATSAFTVTLPTAPANNSIIEVKIVKPANATVSTITIVLGGSDHINRTTGPTSTTMNLLGESITFQYNSGNAVWYVKDRNEALSKSVIKVFNVEYFGAVHDGQVTTTNDGTITSGAAILTSAAGAVFSTSDVGKIILVSGAGAAGAPLKTTILSFQSATQVTLNANASTSVTTANIVWGTDDTAAIQAALNACSSYGNGTVFAPKGIYLIDGALQTSVGGANPNCQIYIPQTSSANSQRSQIILEGEGQVLPAYGSVSWTGTIFYSTKITTVGAISGVIGGIGPTGSSNSFGFNEVILKNFNIRCYTNNGQHAPYISGFYGKFFATISTIDASAYVDVGLDNSATALGSGTYGFYISTILNDGPNIITRGCASGFEYGWNIGEHTILQFPYAIGNYNNYVFWGTSFSIEGQMLSHAAHTQIIFDGTSGQNIPTNVTMHVENDARGKWFDSNTLFTDASNKATGVLRFTNVALSGLASTFTGGANLYLLESNRYITNTSNTSGIYVNSAGFSSTAGVNADFQISTGQTVSTDTKDAGISLVTNQTGTANRVGSFQVLNSAIGTGASDRRLMLDVTTTNGATNTALNYRYALNAGSLKNIWQTDGLRFSFGAVKTFFGNAGTTANAAVHIGQAAAASAWIPSFQIDAPANTALTASTAFPDILVNAATQTWGSGTIAIQPKVWIKGNTLAGTSGTNTATIAAGVQVDPWVVGTNAAITGNYTIYHTGKQGFDKTITTLGTDGNQTINKPSGTVNIAAAGTTVMVTNSFCTATSHVIATLITNDATATIKNVVPAAGSFVINLGAASTGEVAIYWYVQN